LKCSKLFSFLTTNEYSDHEFDFDVDLGGGTYTCASVRVVDPANPGKNVFRIQCEGEIAIEYATAPSKKIQRVTLCTYELDKPSGVPSAAAPVAAPAAAPTAPATAAAAPAAPAAAPAVAPAAPVAPVATPAAPAALALTNHITRGMNNSPAMSLDEALQITMGMTPRERMRFNSHRSKRDAFRRSTQTLPQALASFLARRKYDSHKRVALAEISKKKS
jgi:hypothetical protein